ncbi:MAG TPA: 2OG-Fe(II) oxygenase [Rhizomicrobium sp.]|jgi:SM-20-related protein|nr:2OG-Fe(II) oxygenase [Rhizomicrobium sp.]
MTHVSDDPPKHRPRFLPPHSVRHDFLPPALVADFLAYVRDNQARFEPAKVGIGPTRSVDPAIRVSARLRDLGALKAGLESRLRPLAPVLAAELRVEPFETSLLELELVAHGDGAFYRRHSDLQRDAAAKGLANIRRLSGVYYFHALPRAFSGGALRLHEILPAGDTPSFVDVAPVHNSLVFFPSWMPHEVMPVACPSRRFSDSRFAINCWFHAAL